jgi:hypothetical protein
MNIVLVGVGWLIVCLGRSAGASAEYNFLPK